MDETRKSAIKAKTIAEKKMEKKDFSSALEFSLKAQQLYPDLENISHIISVCDVFCSAKKKVNGNENDWYAILRVEATADEATIRNQYLKLALHLHPDKNKVFGASDAFNLISQAQNVLLDRTKRLEYDKKLQGARSRVRGVNYQAKKQAHVKRQPPYKNSCSNKFTPKCINPLQQLLKNQFVNDKSTFWTKCPHCLSVFMYYKKTIGKKGACQNCKLKFTALENKSFSTLVTSLIKQSSMQREETGTDHSKQAAESGPEKSYSKIELEKDVSDKTNSESQNGFTTLATETSNPKREYSNVEPTTEGSNHLSESINRIDKKRKMDTPVKLVDVESVKNNEAGLCMSTEDNQINIKGWDLSSSKEVTQHGEKDAEKEFYKYPFSEISNFNKGVFKKGQIWAVYDILDTMPRFYAILTKVFSPDFKVELTWLEPDPDHEEEIKWIEEGLPVSCGKFRCGDVDIIEDIEIFSHLVYWKKGSGEGAYEVHPRKGEIWALFKDWDINWYVFSESKKNYAYDFVEVLSDYSCAEGVRVAFLTKLEGSSCNFTREKTESSSVHIPPKEKFRFSHEVPSFKMTGKDSNELVTGLFNLDPASLPTHEDGPVMSDGSISVVKEMHYSSLYSKPSIDLAVNEKSKSEGLAFKEDMESIRKWHNLVGGFSKIEGNQKVDSQLQNTEEIHVESSEDRNLSSNLKSDMEADTTPTSPKPWKTCTKRKESSTETCKFYTRRTKKPSGTPCKTDIRRKKEDNLVNTVSNAYLYDTVNI